MTENGTSFKGPWWATIVERTGALGIVVIMLVGAFFVVRDYTTDMRKTWSDIHRMITAENQAAENARARSDEILRTLVDSASSNEKFLETIAKTVSQRLDEMEKRVGRLEASRPPG